MKLCSRPFTDARGEPDVKLMDEALEANWNAVVRPGTVDTVIHLGDFAHRAAADRLPKLFSRLHGRKILIIGNHDGKETRALPWAEQHEILHTSLNSTAVTLCHWAMRTWPRQRKGALMLFGHSHGRLPGNQQSMDIGVDVMGWSPVRLNQIQARARRVAAASRRRGRSRTEQRWWRDSSHEGFFKSDYAIIVAGVLAASCVMFLLIGGPRHRAASQLPTGAVIQGVGR